MRFRLPTLPSSLQLRAMRWEGFGTSWCDCYRSYVTTGRCATLVASSRELPHVSSSHTSHTCLTRLRVLTWATFGSVDPKLIVASQGEGAEAALISLAYQELQQRFPLGRSPRHKLASNGTHSDEISGKRLPELSPRPSPRRAKPIVGERPESDSVAEAVTSGTEGWRVRPPMVNVLHRAAVARTYRVATEQLGSASPTKMSQEKTSQEKMSQEVSLPALTPREARLQEPLSPPEQPDHSASPPARPDFSLPPGALVLRDNTSPELGPRVSTVSRLENGTRDTADAELRRELQHLYRNLPRKNGSRRHL